MSVMSATTIVRADWGSVTLVEYDALHLIRRETIIEDIHAYWRYTCENDPFRGPDGTPCTLSEGEREWVSGLHETCMNTQNERETIEAARAFVKRFGTLMVRCMTRRIVRAR